MGGEMKVEKIGDYEFHVEMLPPVKGFPMSMKLTPIIHSIGTGNMAQAMAMLPPSEIEEMTNIFSAYTKVKTPAGNLVPLKDYQQVFAGRYDLMLKWLLFCVEANFGSFFGGLEDLANDLAARLQRMFGKPNSPTI